MSDHSCHSTKNEAQGVDGFEEQPPCHAPTSSIDYLLWGSLSAVAVLYAHFGMFAESTRFATWYHTLASSVYELTNTMWWGMAIGIVTVALLSRVPREFVMSVLGSHRGLQGIIRATAAGVLLDLCSHGILMVGAKLYERGASIGQVMAFLIASPWNSFSLTLILIALIGLPWTLAFIVLSMMIAVVVGQMFDYLVRRRVLPDNPQKVDLPTDFRFWEQAKSGLSQTKWSLPFVGSLLIDGLQNSRMVIRWVLFGILLAGLVRAFISPEQFGTYFGPTMAGLGLTVLVATILEVCSEGSTPIAADLLTRAKAPGNSFAFLMTGVSTDYTEVMVLKDVTKSWKIALFLPLLTVPQVLLIAWLINAATL